MRRYFALVLALTASRYAAAETEFSFDEPLNELNTDGKEWDPDASLFAPSDDLYPTTTEDNLFPMSSDPSTAAFADNPSICTNGNQPPSRIRARSGTCADEINSGRSGTAVYDPRIPGTVAEQDEIKQQWCPETAYQGILDIPVCSQYDDIEILSSDLTDFDTGQPLSATGLKIIVTASLSMSCSPFSILISFWKHPEGQSWLIIELSLVTSPSSTSCSKTRAYCCQAWLPRVLEVSRVPSPEQQISKLNRFQLASKYGTGYWCARAMTAQLNDPLNPLSPLDLGN